MKKTMILTMFLALMIMTIVLSGCSQKESEAPAVQSTVQIQVESEVLEAINLTLPDGMTRGTVSNIQHDFLQDGKQVGGIVIVDISDELLGSPYDSYIQISDILGQQLMPDMNPDDIACMGAGGSEYAYMEIYTGQVDGTDIQYFHYLFRGNTHDYDMWFDADFVDAETMSTIMGSMSSDDIPAELNKNPF